MPRPAYSSPYIWWTWLTGKTSEREGYAGDSVRSTLRAEKSNLSSAAGWEESARTTSARSSTRASIRGEGSLPPTGNGISTLIEDPAVRAKVASTKMMGILKAKEKYRVPFDQGLYGAAIVMPQLARSAGWPKHLCVLSVRSFIFLLVNYVAQGCILYMIAKEENVWDAFAGQMFLCDFGKDSNDCPDGPDCVGPGGTIFSPPRVYGWDLWSTRVYVRDSLVALFPHMKDEIHKNVDPGEYGVESYWCRLLCCTLFTVTVMSDLWGSINILRVFFDVPNKAELWIDYEVPDWADKEHAKAIHGWSELDLVKLKVAGMPLAWKIFDVLIILLPKMLLWKITAEAGILFLMEASGIEDIVVNSVALAFILQIDELLCAELMSETTRTILGKLEDYHLEDFEQEIAVEEMTDEELLEKYEEAQNCGWGLQELWDSFPARLVAVFCLTGFFVYIYYERHCVVSASGGFVSHSMSLPVSTKFTLLNAFFQYFFPVETVEETYWTMPDVKM